MPSGSWQRIIGYSASSDEAELRTGGSCVVLSDDFKAVKASFTENMMCLTCARGYIKKLLNNAKVVRFLNANFSDIISGFEGIVAAEAL